MRDYYFLLTALIATFGFSAIVYHGRPALRYHQFRATVAQYQTVVTGYTLILFIAMIIGLFALPLLVITTTIWQIAAAILFMYGFGQGVMEMFTRTAVIVRRQKHKRNWRTVSLETFYVSAEEVRGLGLWRLVAGMLLLGTGWLIPV